MWADGGPPPLADGRLQQRLAKALEEAGLDGVVAATPENVYYLTGFFGLPEWSPRLTQAYAIWAPGEAPALVVTLSELDLAAEQVAPGVDIFCYGRFHYDCGQARSAAEVRMVTWMDNPSFADPVAALDHALLAKHLSGKRIGLDEVGLAPGLWNAVADRQPKLSLCYELLRRVRAVKSEREITILEQVARRTEEAAWQAMRATAPGDSEIDIARRFHARLAERDVLPEVTVVAAGPRSAFPNAPATARCLQRGDLVRLDLCSYYRFYHSDLARTAIVAERGSEEVERAYAALLAGQEAAIAQVRPGVLACDVFAVAVETARREGLPNYQRHHCGHGIGLEGYDPPLIAPSDTTVLEEGMVICIELPLYRLGLGGMQVEDTVVVTATGARLLTCSPRRLWSSRVLQAEGW